MMSTAESQLQGFRLRLAENERSEVTVERYAWDVAQFFRFLEGREVGQALVLEYRARLLERSKPQPVNAKLSAIHAYLGFAGLPGCKVKLLRVQRKAFLKESGSFRSRNTGGCSARHRAAPTKGCSF